MVDFALHVQHGHAAGVGHQVQIAVARPVGHVADGDAVEVTAENLAHLRLRVAVRNLRGAAFNEGRVTAQLRHAGLKTAARARAGEEEQHRQHLVAQQRVRLAQGPFHFQIPGQLQNGFDLFLRKIKVANKVTSSQTCLHDSSPSKIGHGLTRMTRIRC
jgi:hypothetical protein